VVRREFRNATFAVKPADEDIHTAVERRLTELVGPVAGKLHTGRSRNDQVATDLRLHLLSEIGRMRRLVRELGQAIVQKSEEHLGVIMPGHTHLQQAQPVLFSHWLMSHFWRLQRDAERLDDLARRVAVMPLGAGALAGTPFEIDRHALASELGFSGVSQNSIDAVSDRDFVVEFLAWAAILQVHLSSLAEDLIIWSSHEYRYVRLAEAYSTGSSLMPQKCNPDSLELLRGKSGRVTGHLAALLITLKGLPSAYNKDLQEDKEGLFDAIETLSLALPVAAGAIRTLQIDPARMRDALDDGMLATDLADYLVRRGVPFRESHHLVGQAVRRAEELGSDLRGLDLAEFQAIHPAFGEDVVDVFDFARSVAAHRAEGGTAPEAVRVQIRRAKELLA
jgi:argininosuccinate lyase